MELELMFYVELFPNYLSSMCLLCVIHGILWYFSPSALLKVENSF